MTRSKLSSGVLYVTLLLASTTGIAFAQFGLDADPNYDFGATAPDISAMATAIQSRLIKPVTIVNNIPNYSWSTTPEITTGQPPNYIYGPAANGTIENLNLRTPVAANIVNCQIFLAGQETTECGQLVNYFGLRAFTATQYYDVLVNYVGCSGPSVVWSFYAISGPHSLPGGVTDQGSLLNLSGRAWVLTGDKVLIDGFIVTGTGTKSTLVRGIGPSLTSTGVPDLLADPTLELHDSAGRLLATNDNWRDTQEAQIAATGLAPTNDLESAILVQLPPGSYTAILAGKNGGTGVGVCELYDIDQSTTGTHLVNISDRGFVGDTAEHALYGGLIVQSSTGSSPKILIRALGPSLSSSGVAGPLQDPTLEIYDASGTLIASNDNWQTGGQAADIGLTGLAPTNYYESAVILNLQNGNYTAVVRGNNNGTGIALAEVYRLQSTQ